jgi:hypothetical protein
MHQWSLGGASLIEYLDVFGFFLPNPLQIAALGAVAVNIEHDPLRPGAHTAGRLLGD